MFFLFFDFLFNGLGFSWLSDHWNQYNGSMSWPTYRITLWPQGTATAPTPYFPNLRYGFTLADHAQLKAKLLQSEIPVADIGLLLYDTTRFSRFSPDSVYYAWVGLRGNAFSFALGAKPAFVVLHCRAAAAATATVPAYPVQHSWRSRWRLYAWASFSMGICFALAMGSLNTMSEAPGTATRVVALLSLLLLATDIAYVSWCDYHTGGEWYTSKLLWGLGILVTYVIYFFSSKAEPNETTRVEASPE